MSFFVEDSLCRFLLSYYLGVCDRINDPYTAVQSQKTVTAYLKSKLFFGPTLQYTCVMLLNKLCL